MEIVRMQKHLSCIKFNISKEKEMDEIIRKEA
jgi:hypothetical protein